MVKARQQFIAFLTPLIAGLLVADAVGASPSPPEIITAARAECRQGSAEAGLKALRDARLLAPDSPASAADLADSLSVAAECLERQGHVEDAAAMVERALALPHAQTDAGVRFTLSTQLGRLALRTGNGRRAQLSFEVAFAALPANDTGQRRVETLMGLGAAHALNEDFAAAVTAFSQAAVAADTDDNRDGVIAGQFAVARAQLELGDAGAAQAALDKAARAMDVPGGVRSTHQQLQLGELYYRLDKEAGSVRNTSEALRLLTAAADQARREHDTRAESFALGYLGAVAERFGDDDKALSYSRLAAARAAQADAPDGLYQWQWQAARALDRKGEPQLAGAAYQQAIATLEEIRPELTRGSSRNFQKAVAPLFFDMANLLLKQPTATAPAAEVNARLRLVRKTIENLKLAEIQNYFDNDCVIDKEEAAPLDELAIHAAVIYPIIFDDRLEVLISRGSTIRRHTVNVDRQKLTATVREFRLNLERRPTHRYRESGRRLYDWLVGPALEELRRDKVTTLIFVPDGPLRGIPPAALYDGSRFLIEEFAVSTTLGLTLTNPRPIPRESVRMLAGGLTVGREGFSPLPGVAAELEEVNRIYDTTELRDDRFRVGPVTDELSAGNYSVVHIATHGQFNRDFRKSFLLAYDGRITMDILEQTVGLRRFSNEPVELLMLSACETAAGDDQAALGLAGVALKAGARSAVATLWSVYDEATTELVGSFYEHLQDKNMSKADALRQAQLELLKDQRFAHPAAWSPFLLIGNWL